MIKVPNKEPLKPRTTSTLVQRMATVTAAVRTENAVLHNEFIKFTTT